VPFLAIADDADEGFEKRCRDALAISSGSGSGGGLGGFASSPTICHFQDTAMNRAIARETVAIL